MLQIIRRLAQDDSCLTGVAEARDHSLDHQFNVLWNKLLTKGWSDHNTSVGIDRLHHIGGSTWLVTVLVKVYISSLFLFTNINFILHFVFRRRL